jgi:hypothetical protein
MMTLEEQFAEIKAKTPPPPPPGSKAMTLLMALSYLQATRRTRDGHPVARQRRL